MVKKYILNALLINICLISYLILLVGFIITDELKPLAIIGISILYLLSLVFIIYCYLNKKNLIYNIGIIFTIIVTIVCLFKIDNLNKNYSYLENFIYHEYKYNTYEIYVNKKNPTYSNLNKLQGKKIGMLSKNSRNVQNYLDKVSNVKYQTYLTRDELINALNNYEVQSIIISTEDLNQYKDQNNIKSKIVSIGSKKIKEQIS